MKRLVLLLGTGLGRKIVMGVTGLAMIGFLITHVSANLLLLVSKESYNAYSHVLISNPLIYIAEFGLIVLFVSHFATGIVLQKGNTEARAVAYENSERAGAPSRKSLASTTMIVTGVVMLIFVPLHLITFKFGEWYTVAGEPDVRDLHRLTYEIFQKPYYVVGYVVALALMGMHAWHGFGSAFESLGVAHSRGLRHFGQALALFITGGFIVIPIVIFMGGGVQ